MEDLIYDRTYEDVVYAETHKNSKEILKGALNYTDLNRIEEWCIYLKGIMNTLNISVTVTPVKLMTYNFYKNLIENTYETYKESTYEKLFNADIWDYTDTITMTKINQIRKNIDNLQTALGLTDFKIEYSNTLDYKQLNILENVLYNVWKFLELKIKSFVYFGQYYCGEEMTLAY